MDSSGHTPSERTPSRNHSPEPSTQKEETRSDVPIVATGALNETPAGEDPDLKLCWICQQDEDEDNSSPWLRPCPCSLVAHEECLLEWIASEEKPKPGELPVARQILCPVCKAEIKIARPPRDPIVALYEILRYGARLFLLPAGLSAVAGCVYSGFFVYGLNTVLLVFGAEEGERMLQSAIEGRSSIFSSFQKVIRWLESGFLASDPFFPQTMMSWKLGVGLPLIGPALILLRTRLSEFTFPLLVPVYLLNHYNRDIYNWPPTPGLTFATLPYICSAYSRLYRFTFADLESKWDLAVQRTPREGETPAQIAQEDRDGGAMLHLEIADADADDVAEPELAAWLRNNEPQIGANPLNAPVEGGQENQENAGQEDVNPPPGPGQDAPENRAWGVRGRRDVDLVQIAAKIMGALAFPAISSLMGDAIGLLLPSKPVGIGLHLSIGRNGLLKEKWGRTIAGGCLFVVLKDAVTLYCKWKKAKDFGKRKVIEYVRPISRN